MRRVVTVVVVTIGGLALIGSFHSTPGVATRLGARGRTALQPPAGGTPPTDSPTSPSVRGAPSSSAAPPTSAVAASRTYTGSVESNRFGDVQVEVVVQNGQLVDVESVVLPSDRERSRYISSIAGPDLRQEALQARSANIDVVTGATYTSESYAQSLQSALDQAGL